MIKVHVNTYRFPVCGLEGGGADASDVGGGGGEVGEEHAGGLVEHIRLRDDTLVGERRELVALALAVTDS